MTTAPHYGDDAVYRTPIKVFTCPASEFKGLSPDATLLPNISRLQGALHYRAVGGTDRVDDFWVTGTQNVHSNYSTSGVIYPYSQTKLPEITDGTSNTLLFGETSSLSGRAMASRGWAGIQPWTWGYYSYDAIGPPVGTGVLMIDHKLVKYPIGYSGSFPTNETPFTSNHQNGVNVAMCDGSIRFLTRDTDVEILKNLATRLGNETVSLP